MVTPEQIALLEGWRDGAVAWLNEFHPYDNPEHLARGLVPTTVEALAFVRLVLEERPLTVYELLHASLVGEGRYSDGSGPKPRGWTEMESAAVLALCNMRVAAAAAGTVLEGVISSVGDSAGGSDE